MGRSGSDPLTFPGSRHLLLAFVSHFSLWCLPGDTYTTGVRKWLRREAGGGAGIKHPSPRKPDRGEEPRGDGHNQAGRRAGLPGLRPGKAPRGAVSEELEAAQQEVRGPFETFVPASSSTSMTSLISASPILSVPSDQAYLLLPPGSPARFP